MDLYYVSHSRLPTDRAHGFQIMAMCSAFVQTGNTVTLLVSQSPTISDADPFDYYHIARTFMLHKLWTIDWYRGKKFLHKLLYWIGALTFACSTTYYLLTHPRGIIFSRDVVSSFLLVLLGFRVVFEVHDVPVSPLYTLLFKKAVLIVVTNTYKKDVLMQKWGIGERSILVAHHGVDATPVTLSSDKCRTQLGISQDKKIIVYTGHLYKTKGAHTLVDAAQQLPADMQVVLVGGTPESIAEMKAYCREQGIDSVMIVGNVPHPLVPLYLQAADVLVIPSSGKYVHGSHESSPLKLFEYLASGKPVVASDLPAIREAAGDHELCFFEADSADSLADAVKKSVGTSQRRAPLVSWKDRAQIIVDRLCQP